MTQVFVTRTGVKYHARVDCASFLDAERERGRRIDRWAKDLRGLSTELTRCSRCWPLIDGYDAWHQFALDVEQRGDSPFESIFVEHVLRRVSGLSPSDVAVQRKTTGRSGDTYYLDFVLSPPGGHRIAVEIDGRDKDPGVKTPAEVTRDVERKRADLVSAGWRVLNFRNEQVSTQSEQCVSEIRAALQDAVQARDPSQVTTAPFVTASGAPQSPTTSAVSGRGKRIAWLVAGAVLAMGIVTGGWWLLTSGGDAVDPVRGECPSEAPIKGNITGEGEKIYHQPGWEFYSRTGAESCFASEADAESNGYRASQVR